jgi:hypothetical protein
MSKTYSFTENKMLMNRWFLALRGTHKTWVNWHFSFFFSKLEMAIWRFHVKFFVFFRSSVQTFVFLAPFFFPGELWESLFWCDSQALFYCWTQPVAFWQEETQDEETPQTEEVAAEELPPVENKSPIPEPRKNPCRTEQSILNQISVGLP